MIPAYFYWFRNRGHKFTASVFRVYFPLYLYSPDIFAASVLFSVPGGDLYFNIPPFLRVHYYLRRYQSVVSQF